MTKPKFSGQRAYEKAGHRKPWADIGGLNRARWEVKGLKRDAQAAKRTEQDETRK